ncbi:MAG: ABC transporter ATP-binding protein [Novosphingobium sp.]
MTRAGPRLFDPAVHGRAAAWLGTLMVIAALTEGAGIILLVPLLTALGQGGAGQIGTVLASLGIPGRLDALLVLFVLLVTVRALVVHLRGLAALRLEAGLVDALRSRAWAALLHCNWRVLMGLNRSNTASLLISRIDRSGQYVNQVVAALATSATLGGIGLAALAISPILTFAATLAGLAVLLAFHGMRRRVTGLGEALSAAYADVYGRINEGLGALRVIKSLGAEDRVLTGLMTGFVDMRRTQMAYQRDLGLGQSALQVGGAAVLALLVWLALERWHSPAAAVLPMVALFARALPLIAILQQTLLNTAHARPAVREALELIGRAEAAREPDNDSLKPPGLTNSIQLEGATVRYAGEPQTALDAVTATIPARGITAISGPSGAGKSTLADLIGGLLEPDSGRVLIDGKDLDGPVRQAWRRRVAYVQQDPVLLSASLRDNLRWAAPDASDAELETALKAASAEFALSLPMGLDTHLGDGGRFLSGGERQRLMLARALLRDPALLILDEATSALDAENEAQIAAALTKLGQRMAVVVIAHRGALTELADHEIRLDSGRCLSVD